MNDTSKNSPNIELTDGIVQKTADDTISRQAAIDAILDLADFVSVIELFEYVEDHNQQDSRLGGIIDAIDAVLLLPSAQSEPRWIPCSERLPEEKQDVLLLMPQNMVVGFWEDVLCDGGRTWYANSGNGYFTDMDVLNGYDDPIAWMPLPEPYQEVKE